MHQLTYHESAKPHRGADSLLAESLGLEVQMIGFRPIITRVLDRLLINGHNTRSIVSLGQGTRSPGTVRPRLCQWDSLFWLNLDGRATFNPELTPNPSSARMYPLKATKPRQIPLPQFRH